MAVATLFTKNALQKLLSNAASNAASNAINRFKSKRGAVREGLRFIFLNLKWGCGWYY